MFLDESTNEELYKSIKARGEMICSYIGNIGLAQGIKQLVYIAERCQDEKLPIFFLVYGSGAEEEKLRNYVEQIGLTNLSFEGRLPNKDMKTVLSASDLNFVSLVNANLKDSVPTKLYEALGVGCPVFLVAEGDSTSVLKKSKLGISISPNEKKEIWGRFKEMLLGLEEITKHREFAMELIRKEYSLQRSAVMMVDVMEHIAGKV